MTEKKSKRSDRANRNMVANFHYMLTSCGVDATPLALEEDKAVPKFLSKNTILNFCDIDKVANVLNKSIEGMVNIYNKRMKTNITVDDFKNKDLSQIEIPETNEKCAERTLIGDYIVFYLDSIGSGNILGMYLRIEEGNNASIVAHAIHKIRDIDVLMEIDANDLFSGCIEEKLATFMSQYQSQRKNSKYFFGSVNSIGFCSTINLAANRGLPQYRIMMDLERYSEEKDTRTDGYRGGLGLAVVTNSTGTYCMRIGLVKKDFVTKTFLSKADEIRDFLKINPDFNNNKWYPVRLSKTLDSRWYVSFMGCYESEEKQTHHSRM